ncbi:hypothetical protein V7S43_018887 [Phytophthora oleae]|uniref:Glucosamine/galactosamine-6-phosphate isomerase domain-containing protein n=1 Tax=Phytophthora oleae TaxID=2107226 RepID=A0ABD3ET52_9STRA
MAVDYTKKLAEVWGSDVEKTLFVASIQDSPKPPSQRITLTYPVVNNAANIHFSGCVRRRWQGRADSAHDRHREAHAASPAANVKPTDGVVYWFIDEDAAAKLSDEARM